VLSTTKVLPRRVAVIGAVLMLGLAWVVGASQLTRASAATIDNAITSVSIKQASAGPNTAMELDLTWAVPDSSNSGDTFTLKLPAALSSMTTSFDLLAPDSSVVAKATVVNGLVTFTLTNYVDTHNNVHGSAFFAVRWSKAESSVTGPVTLDFTAGSEVFHDVVTKTGTGTTAPRTNPHKSGFWTNVGTVTGTDALTWTLDSGSGPFNTAKFTDHLSAGQTYDCSTLRFRLLKIDSTGAITSIATLPASKVISSSCTTSSLSATLGPAVAGQVLRVTYMTDVTDPNLTTYSNSADINIDGTKTSTVSSSVKVQKAGGSGSGNTPSSSSTSATSTHTSPSSTHTSPSSTHTSPSVSGTSIHASPSGKPTVLGVKLTAGSSPKSLAFTGASVGPALLVAALLVGAGLLLLVGVQLPSQQRRH
jgi:uncharacterized surface anchored protein